MIGQHGIRDSGDVHAAVHTVSLLERGMTQADAESDTESCSTHHHLLPRADQLEITRINRRTAIAGWG